MKKLTKYSILITSLMIIFLIFIINICNGQTIMINEVMESNSSIIADEDGDYSDWLELYNESKQNINLSDYYITDNKYEPNKWRLPNIQLNPNDHLIIFCSGKDRLEDELHTNFKIKKEGETIRLYDYQFKEIDTILSLNIPTNFSFGSEFDGANDKVVFQVPTPGLENKISLPYFNGIHFSHTGGIYESDIELVLNDDDTTDIFYTLDGSIPTTQDYKYKEILQLDKTFFSNKNISSIVMSHDDLHHEPVGIFPKAIVLRAARFYKENLVSPVSTQTYIIKDLTSSFIKLPIVSLTTDSNSLFNQDSGIFTPGIYADSLNIYSGNYFKRGFDWERLINVEYFSPNNSNRLNQECGLRIHGWGSSISGQKAMRLYARDVYGKSTFDSKVLSEKSISNFKRLILKPYSSSWNENLSYDYLAGRMARNLRLDYLAADPILLFINGEYWGIYFLQERFDEKYLYQNKGIEKDSVDIIETWGGMINHGDNEDFLALYDFIKQNDLSLSENYHKVANWIDIDNFIEYQIFQYFISNRDWPANNMKCWRERKIGAKWKWFFYDGDAALQDLTFNGLKHSIDNDAVFWGSTPESTLFLRKLLINNNFKGKYIQKLKKIINDEIYVFKTQNHIDSLLSLFNYEINNQSRRFGRPVDKGSWEAEILSFRRFLNLRKCQVAIHAEDMFDINFSIDGCLKGQEMTKELLVLPNPSSGNFQILFDSNEDGIANIEVLNIGGQVIYNKKIIINKNFNTINLSIDVNGLHFVRLLTEKMVLSGKVMLR